MYGMYGNIFNSIQLWGLWWQKHSSIFGCFRSLTCRNAQPLFKFNIWTDLAWRILLIFGGTHSSFHSHNISCAPSCHTTPKHIGSTSMLNSWQGVVLYKGFTLFSPSIPSLVVAKKFNFLFVSPKHIVPKGFRLLNVFFWILQMLHFVLRSW